MLCPEGLAASISAIAMALAKDKSAEQLTLMSSVFMQLADTIATIVAARQLCESQDKANQVSNSNGSTITQSTDLNNGTAEFQRQNDSG